MDNLSEKIGFANSEQVGKYIEDLVDDALSRRRGFERRWYDNNFFDDGYHFRVISKKTGRVIDHTSQNNGYVERAIPRASRHIRANANLMYSADPYPVVYPERVNIYDYMNADGSVNEVAYNQKRDQVKKVAKKQGIWLSNEWDNLELNIKMIDMILLAAKHGVSWLHVYSQEGKIQADVYDAFDVICYGEYRNYKNLPFITKTSSMSLQDVMRSPLFDSSMVKKVSADNKYATSEIKEAYMRMRYGNKGDQDKDKKGTVIVKETYIPEKLNEGNWKKAAQCSDKNGCLEGKSKGDKIIRQVMSAGGVTLSDEYIDYDKYSLVPLRFEPGSLYQVPLIERFIPQNKSLDVIMTRLEKWVNAMVVGVYQKRKGENFQLSNFPGGQVVEYETTPLTQMQNGSVGATPFNVIDMLNKYTDEWGSTTAGGINVPSGVKSGVAIESVKATEYANLKIPILMLNHAIQDISDCILERAAKDYIKPIEQTSLEDGEPSYFDVIGERGMMLMNKIGQSLPRDIVPITKDIKFRIEIEPGLGHTMQGKREAMQQIIEYMVKMSELGYVTKEALGMIVKRFLESFGYGNTSEFMDAMDNGTTKEDMTEEQIAKLKIGIIEALRDAGAVGPEMESRLVESTKVGVVEAMKDTGMIDGMGGTKDTAQKQPSQSISFKDLPPEGKAQLAAKAGIQLNPVDILKDDMSKQAIQNKNAKNSVQ